MGKESSKSSTPDSECSDLKEDLYNKKLADSAMCRCGDQIEDAEPYLIYSTNYQEFRDNSTDALGFNIFEHDILSSS